MNELVHSLVHWIPYIAYPILAATHIMVAFAVVTRYSYWVNVSRARRLDRMLFAAKNIMLAAGFISLMIARVFSNRGNPTVDSLMLDAARSAFFLAAVIMLIIVTRAISYGRVIANSPVLPSKDQV